VLIACRLLQAIGGGTILPSCTGIVADAFPAHRGRAIGLFSSIFPIGGILGPNIGGLVIDYLSWRFIFYVNVPISIAVLVLTWWLYHAPREKRARQSIDFLGVGYYGSALAILLIGLSWLGEHPHDATHAPLLYLAVLAAFGLFYLWYRHEHRTPSPMMEMRLLKERPFLAANAYAFFWGAGVFGFVAFLPTFAQLHYHMSATAAGVLLTPRSILMIVVSTVASFYLLRFGYRLPMIGGIVLVWVSLLLVGLGPEHPPSLGIPVPGFAYLAISIAILGFGFGLSGPASNNAAIDLTPENVAAITGIRAMFRQTGGTIGTAATVFVAALFADPSRGLQVMFLIMSFIMLTIIPWVFLIPDTAKQQWRALQESGGREQPALLGEGELAGD
jgi:MFS family permease